MCSGEKEEEGWIKKREEKEEEGWIKIEEEWRKRKRVGERGGGKEKEKEGWRKR